MQRIKSMISSLCGSVAAMSASVFAVLMAICIVTAALGGAASSMTAYAETQAVGEQQQGEKDTEEEAAEYTEAKLEQQIAAPESVREGEELLGETLTKVVENRQEALEEQKSAVIVAKTKTQKIEEERARQAEEEAQAEAAVQAVSYSEGDYEVLQRIVEAEAGVCDEKGKILVANVILNRVRSEKFPNTIAEVVYQNRQFSPVANGSIDRCTVSAETTQAVDRALAGEDYSEGALYFMNRTRSHSRSVNWFDGRLTYLFRYEKHEFYK